MWVWVRPTRPLVFGAAMAVALAIGAGTLWMRGNLPASRTPDCTGAQSLDLSCFAARFEALTRQSGPAAALAELGARRGTNRHLLAGCHQLTHVIGRTAGDLHGPAAFRHGSDLCASGYYHGVIESVMTRIGPERILSEARAVCAEYRDRDAQSYLHYNCVHGMGHGFMSVFGSDVFRSIDACDALPSAWEQHHCYGGVFMENLTALSNPSRPSKHLRADQPLYPCTAVPARYKGDCYMKQTAYALHVHNNDFGAVFGLCRDAADPEFRAVCYQGLGGDAAIVRAKFVIGASAQAATVRNLCLQGPDTEARTNCVAGAVTTIIRDVGGDAASVTAVCDALDGEMAAACEGARRRAAHGVPLPEGSQHHHSN